MMFLRPLEGLNIVATNFEMVEMLDGRICIAFG